MWFTNTICQTVNEILRGNTRGVSARETRELAVSSRVSGRKNLTKVCTMPTINPVSFEWWKPIHPLLSSPKSRRPKIKKNFSKSSVFVVQLFALMRTGRTNLTFLIVTLMDFSHPGNKFGTYKRTRGNELTGLRT